MNDTYYYVCLKNKNTKIGYCNRSYNKYIEFSLENPDDYTTPVYFILNKKTAMDKVGTFLQTSLEIQTISNLLQTNMIIIQHYNIDC